MSELLQNCIIILLEILCCKVFFDIFLLSKIKVSGIKIINALVSLFVLFVLISKLPENVFLLKEILMVVVITACMRFYMEISLLKTFLMAVIYRGMVFFVDYVFNLSRNPVTFYHYYRNSTLFMIFQEKVFLFLFLILVKYLLWNKKAEELKELEWLSFLFFPLFSIGIFIISKTHANLNLIVNAKQERFCWLLGFGLVIMNMIVFYLLQNVTERGQQLRENKIFELEARNQLELYESISENIERQRETSHEYKNQLACIHALCENKDYDALNDYVEQINDRVLHIENFINTNHPMINAVLNAKYQEAVEKDITVIFKINDLSKIQMENQDIVLLFSNMMNNAIEACEKCQGEKRIKIKLVQEDGNFILAVSNTFNGKILYDKDGKIQTTKKRDRENHGIGLKNIIRIVDKYDGTYSIDNTKNEFFVSVVIEQ